MLNHWLATSEAEADVLVSMNDTKSIHSAPCATCSRMYSGERGARHPYAGMTANDVSVCWLVSGSMIVSEFRRSRKQIRV